MRFIQVILALQLVTSSLEGQDVDSISLGILEDAVNQYSKGDTIFYADGITNNVFKMFKDSLTHSYLRGVDFLSSKREIVKIQLSKEDQGKLRSGISKMTKFVWPDQLFKNSIRIPKDSIFAFNRKRWKLAYNKFYDTSNGLNNRGNFSVLAMKMATVYQFMPPVFLRQGTIAVFYYLRFCSGVCGNDELAVYKLEKGKYKRWLLIYGGAF
jgi:hypothetical protein